MAENKYDLMIVGAGPAGLTAAIYAQRLGIKTVVFGDTPDNLHLIENLTIFPGLTDVPDPFGNIAFAQAKKEGAFLPMTWLNLLSHDGEQFMGVDSGSRQYFATTALIACGASPIKPDVPNVNKKGIFFSSLHDGPSFQNQKATLAVIGEGMLACQESLWLSRFAERVILICKGKALEAESSMTELIEKKTSIYVLLNTQIVSFVGQDKIEGILIIIKGKEKKKIRVNGVFTAIGWKPNMDMLKISVRTTDEGLIKTDKTLMSSFPGLFAAGDVRETDIRQVITNCADGTRAAFYVLRFLEGI